MASSVLTSLAMASSVVFSSGQLCNDPLAVASSTLIADYDFICTDPLAVGS